MFGDRLKDLRERKQLTQNEFASILGIGRTTLSHYELNNREPDFETLEKIANYFDVSIDYLVGRTNLKTFDEYVFHNDFQALSEKLESANPEVRKMVVNILDKIFLSIFYPIDDNNVEFLTKLKKIYDCIYGLNSSLKSDAMASALNNIIDYDGSKNLSLQDKLKILSKYKNDLNILLDDLFEYYINQQKPTE
ncbi:helix-turn-helix transcriptional regulator [Clostridium sporogenes]|uniref:Helix-turn-helix transcriptional regulator n=1 Tax=Clostridium sporogenes TaxID=1509 RepID=A0AAE4FPM2_CLOSG|nr:helix-turn-helix transcriptional regulator [Clostridium sporogenes]MDS1004925.1 helix-turn-helix transcriptional regulator [Clostridium sporogenes]